MSQRGEPKWLLLIHQIPPKPNYFRVKIGRRLQRLGSVPIKNSVYVLPRSEQSYEDFEWVVREIVEGGGEASVCEARFVEGLSDAEVEACSTRLEKPTISSWWVRRAGCRRCRAAKKPSPARRGWNPALRASGSAWRKSR